MALMAELSKWTKTDKLLLQSLSHHAKLAPCQAVEDALEMLNYRLSELAGILGFQGYGN